VTALAPTGALRVGVVEAPNAGVVFVGRDAHGAPVGVTADLGAALAASIGVPVAYTVFPNSGELTEATAAAAVDVAFMPVDDARREMVSFGPAYYLLESTYLVSEASGIATLDEVDRPGVRVVGIANTTTIRASARSLTHTQPVACRGVDEAIAMIIDGHADALALSRDSLNQILPPPAPESPQAASSRRRSPSPSRLADPRRWRWRRRSWMRQNETASCGGPWTRWAW
jgi:polar amino acid transport system substrate-binding protein